MTVVPLLSHSHHVALKDHLQTAINTTGEASVLASSARRLSIAHLTFDLGDQY